MLDTLDRETESLQIDLCKHVQSNLYWYLSHDNNYPAYHPRSKIHLRTIVDHIPVEDL